MAHPPNPFRALAATTTPVVAAAVLALGAVAGGCDGGPRHTPGGTSAVATAAPAGTPADRPPASPPAGRLLVVTGVPDAPRAVISDPAAPSAGGHPISLPEGAAPLAAVAAAPDGRLAAVSAGGQAWVTGPVAAGGARDLSWRPIKPLLAAGSLPGPVLDAAWSDGSAALLLLAGEPGSGIRRTAVVRLPTEGRATSAEVPFEANGPGLADLGDGRVAFVGRDRLDREMLVLVAPDGTFAAAPAGIRALVAGGDAVAGVGDEALLVGTLADLQRGILPASPLPIGGAVRIGALAVAPDGAAIAVVQLHDDGRPDRIEILRRTGDGWARAGTLPVAPGTGSAFVAWVP